MVQNSIVESKVAAAMTATVVASTSNVHEGDKSAFLAFVNERAHERDSEHEIERAIAFMFTVLFELSALVSLSIDDSDIFFGRWRLANKRDGNTQGIARSITFKFSVLFGIAVVHNKWYKTAFVESKVAAAMTATVVASTSNVHEGDKSAFLAFVNERATAAVIGFTIFAILFILAGHFRIKIKTATTTTEKSSTAAAASTKTTMAEAWTAIVILEAVASEITEATVGQAASAAVSALIATTMIATAASRAAASSAAIAFLFCLSIFGTTKRTESAVATIVLAAATIERITWLQLQIGCNTSSSICIKMKFSHLDCYPYRGNQYRVADPCVSYSRTKTNIWSL